MTQIIEKTATQNIEERGLLDFTSAAASIGGQATQAIGDVVKNIENDLVTFKNFALNEINIMLSQLL